MIEISENFTFLLVFWGNILEFSIEDKVLNTPFDSNVRLFLEYLFLFFCLEKNLLYF